LTNPAFDGNTSNPWSIIDWLISGERGIACLTVGRASPIPEGGRLNPKNKAGASHLSFLFAFALANKFATRSQTKTPLTGLYFLIAEREGITPYPARCWKPIFSSLSKTPTPELHTNNL